MTPEEIRAALLRATKNAENADRLAEWYSGNNPGKQRRLDERAITARAEVRSLEGLLRDGN
jgi:hypothetical protein